MIHVRVLEAYVYFAVMYTVDNISPVLLIKDLISKYGKTTMSYKLAIDRKP